MYRVVLAFTCLITCSNCSLVRFTVLTQVSPAVVPVGDAAVITCRTSIVLQLLEVRWIRIQGGNYSIINIFRDGKDQQRCDLPEYVGRTEVMAEGLAQGRVALRLFNVSVADEGTHRCFLKGVYYFDMSDLELRVSALGSVPRIDIEGFQDGALKAVCRSAGWYPKPALVNKEDDGEMEIRQEENGLYNIEYPRVITENSNRTFSCRLWTMFPDQQRESLIYVAVCREDRTLLKMRPDHVLSALVGLALISSGYVLGWFTALPGHSPVVAVGDTAVLHCRTSIPAELIEVRWIRIRGGIYSIINLFRDGRDQQRCDLPEYVGRTELVKDGLARGRVALKVFNVSVADEGTYRCALKTVNYFDFTDLKLSAKALGFGPRIDIEGFQDGGVKAVCRSEGWYPKPMLVNEEDDGEMEIRQEENGLYSIEYSHVITENSNRTFSCGLRTLLPHQERESSIHVADGLFRKCADPTALIVLAAIAAAASVLAAAVPAAAAVAAARLALHLWTRQRNRRGNKQRNKPALI